LREGVAQIKQALEIALVQTKDRHAIADEKDKGKDKNDRTDDAT
jgi:hypothetical protein